MSERRLNVRKRSTQVNVLSPIFLALLLAPLLNKTAATQTAATSPLPSPFIPRIIFTGSTVAEVAPTKSFDIDAPLKGLNDPKRYKAGDRYNESKVSCLFSKTPEL